MLHLSNTKGFTLIETIVVIALLVVVGGALGNILPYFYKTNAFVIQEGTAVQSARRGMTFAMQDLREASYGDDGSYPISAAATSTVTFYSDVSGNGNIDKVRYYLSKGTLYRGVTNSVGNPPSYTGQSEAITTIATYVVNANTVPVFQYYDNAGTELTTPIDVSQIASVKTTLYIDVDPNRSPQVYTLTGSATLRNLR